MGDTCEAPEGEHHQRLRCTTDSAFSQACWASAAALDLVRVVVVLAAVGPVAGLVQVQLADPA